jgi:methanogenesis imperfect marker protein 11
MTKILSPEEIKQKFGQYFCRGIYTMVDEKNNVAQIIEECSAKGPVEWDAVNRKRAKGAITKIRVEGTTLIMDTIIGERELKFGAASKDLGGQGLRSLTIDGDNVRTAWVGLAGASVGIGACMPQGPGTICAEYPDEIRIGGAHRIEVTVVTPKLVRVIIGVDDTDTREKGATWASVLKLARSCPVGHFLEHKIIQLNPEAPEKTTNCTSSAVSFAIAEKEVEDLVQYFVEGVRKETLSDHTVVAAYVGLKVPDPLVKYGWEAKSILYNVDSAFRVAEQNGVRIFEITGRGGAIGAVSAIGCFDLGLRASGLPEDFEN